MTRGYVVSVFNRRLAIMRASPSVRLIDERRYELVPNCVGVLFHQYGRYDILRLQLGNIDAGRASTLLLFSSRLIAYDPAPIASWMAFARSGSRYGF